MARRTDQQLMCPSAKPEMADAQVLGVVSREGAAPQIAYVNERVAVTPDILEATAPAHVSQVFRLAARCEEKKCMHFDGSRCQLAVRIATLMPEVVDSLPPCAIRRDCRWFRQEGRAACLRCPQVMTGNDVADQRLQEVAGVQPQA